MAEASEKESREAPEVVIPEELPILSVIETVVFPGAVVPLMIGRGPSLKLVDQCMAGDRMLGLVTQKTPTTEDPGPDDLHNIGTAGAIVRMLRFPDGTLRVLVQGYTRFRIAEFTQKEPFLKARIETLRDIVEPTQELSAMQANLVNEFRKLASLIPYMPEELQVMVMNTQDPGRLTDLIAANLNISVAERHEFLSELDVKKRIERLTTTISRERELLELGSKIQSEVQSEVDKTQKDYMLRQQLKAIQKELGEGDARGAEIEELRKKIEEAKMAPEADKAALQELDRLRLIPPESAEHTVVRTYLDWLIALPWSVSTEDHLDLQRAHEILDADHYGLDKIKDRILEYLAVRKLKSDSKGPILCFVGPPGTGKTSLGRSIARALGRKFIRQSLGGVRDEAEIRGHRRTYIGALPGRIIQNLRTAGSNNPLFMLDEIDKLGMDFRGDPSSALLEVLDPEQNFSFVDHYLDVPFDLSKVLFVTTANLLDPIPPALKDRMEVLELSGYIEEEKFEIARRHLIPKQLRENGISAEDLILTDEALTEIIRSYTREAGVRNLEREIGRVCRRVARAIAEGKKRGETVTVENLSSFVGPKRFFSEVAERTQEPGVATGLAWTPNGGEILFVESTKMKGKKGLTLTGNLGDVMKESAQAALSYIRSQAKALAIPEDFFEELDLHIHVPAGSIPKDGPSAGVTIASSLASLLCGKPVKANVAMTGEITLRGRVLPVGGIKEKVLAAKRAGIDTIVLPKHNEKDIEDIPPKIREELRFVFVEHMAEVLKVALSSDHEGRSASLNASA